MVANLVVYRRAEANFADVLIDNDFEVEQVTETVTKVTRMGEMPVFIHTDGTNLYFEADLGSVNGLAGQELFMDLLDINTEILPVSVGIDSTTPEDPRLVLLESREAENLDENELLSVLNALELATDKVAQIIKKYV